MTSARTSSSDLRQGRPQQVVAALKRFFLGDDVFVSYSRQDASGYALALAAALTRENLSCYLDQWGTRPGEELPDTLVRSLKRSTMFVLLGSRGAAQSRSVEQEVSLFLETGRSLVPVSFDGALEQADYYERLGGLAVFAAPADALQSGTPAPALIARIVNAEGFTSRSKRLRQTLWGTTIVVALLVIAGASLAGYYAALANAQRRVSNVLKLSAESILALKQDRNPTKAHALAGTALAIDPSSVPAWGALLDARYSQTYRLQGHYCSVPFSETFTVSGILGTADLSGDGKTLAAGSWDPYLARMWRLDGGDTVALTGFTGPVWRIRFSPDDSAFLVAAKTGPARIYDRQGALRCRLALSGRLLNSAEYSGDGKHVVAGFEDGSAQVWDASSGTETVRLTGGHRTAVTSAFFSADSRRILTASADGNALIWDEQGNVLVELRAGPERLNMAVFSPDSLRIVTASESGEARIWEADGRQVAEIQHRAAAVGAAWAPDGLQLVTYYEDGTLKLVGRDGDVLRTIQAHASGVNGARFSADGELLLSYGDDKTIKLWTAEGQPLVAFGEFTGPVLAAGISRDGLVYGSSWDGTVKVFPLDSHPLTTYSGQTGTARVRITPDGDRVLSVSTTGRAVLWHRDGTPIKTIDPEAGWLNDLTLSPGGDLAFIHADKGGVLWDLNSLEWKRLAIGSAVTGARFFPDGERLLTGSADHALRIWDRRGEPAALVGHSAGMITDVDISPDGTRIAVALDTGRIEIRSAREMKELWHRDYHNQEPVNSIRFSSTGDFTVSAGSGDYRALLVDADGNLLEVFKHSDDVLSAVFSEDDRYVLTNSSDGSAKLWTRDGKLQADLRSPTSVNRALLSRDMRFIATASNDGRVRLWDLAGTLLTTLPAGDRSISWIDLSEEGDWLVSASSDGHTHGWDLRTGRPVAQVVP